MKRILLKGEYGKNKFITIDNDDYEIIKMNNWFLLKSGYVVRNTPRIKGIKRTEYLHRIIAKTPIDYDTHHKNNDKLDNRKCNLEILVREEHLPLKSLQRNNSSGYKGVSWFKRDRKWHAYIKYNGKQYHLGYFNDIKKAAIAYNKMAKRVFNNKVRLNNF